MNDSLLAETSPSVNYDKSIKRQRLVYKLSFGIIYDYFLTYLGSLMLVGMSTLFIPMMINGLHDVFKLTLIVICCVLFDIWMIANLVLTHALVRIDGKDVESNKKAIHTSLVVFYDNIDASRIDGNIIRNIKLSTSFRWGRIITILLDDDKVYLNVITLGRYDSPSPFHGLYNYIKCKRIAQMVIDKLSLN